MKRLSSILPPIIVALLAGAAFWLLFRELNATRFQEIRASFNQIAAWRLWTACWLVVLNYVWLVGYDWLAVRSTGRPLSLWRTAFVSFAGFVTSNNFGALLGGGSIRYRLYSAWGFTTIEIIQMVAMLGVTFWMGLFFLGGVLFVVRPLPLPEALGLSYATTRPIGFFLLIVLGVYLALTLWKRTWRFGETEVRLPGIGTTLLQIGVAAIDFFIAAACLYVLAGDVVHQSYMQFLSVMLLAMTATVLSHVPGGLGIFELVIIKSCGTEATPGVLAALLAFRFVYYLLPLGVVTVMLIGNELAERRHLFTSWWKVIVPWGTAIGPQLLAASTFVGGVVLLLSGATPIVHSRLQSIHVSFPLPLIEVSHFVGSLTGAGLLVLGIGLQRRLDSAWWMAIVLTLLGIFTSLLKGLEFEEAIFLSLILVALIASRGEFYRRGSLIHSQFKVGWLAAIVLAVGSSIWLGIFVHKHTEYSSDLWWTFALRGDASRFLRGSVAAVSFLGLIALRKLLDPAQLKPAKPTHDELNVAANIIQTVDSTSANLALLGDKHLLFNESRTGFVMFGIQGRTWVAMGDPVGDEGVRTELAWSFRELVDVYDGWPVFYQIGEENLPVYINQGLTLMKIGEEARVLLDGFSLDGPNRKGLRHTVNRVQREHCRFEMLSIDRVPNILPELHAISDDWLAGKDHAEKGFSLGYFQENYLTRFPCAIVYFHDRPIAFANVLQGGNGIELSIDLMRYRPDSVSGVMEYLIIETMKWGAENGYRWFNLGMAPLSGIPDRATAPLWNRTAALAYHHGDLFYHFEGLRKYKEKFDPVWTPRFLASPGGWILPTILTDLSRLIGQHSPKQKERTLLDGD